ncbi:MAG: Fe-S cluster assembly protein SufD [Bacteroidota bacterium]
MSSVIESPLTLVEFLDAVPAPQASNAFEPIRNAGNHGLATFPFPTKKHEEWRFTDLKSISKHHFVSITGANPSGTPDINPYLLPEALNSRLVFVNGVFSSELSSLDDLPSGVIVGNLPDVKDHEHVSFLGSIVNYEEDVFVALNDANIQDGAYIYVPKETVIEAPIHILNVFTDAEHPFYATPRVLFVGEMYSKATIIEEHVGLGNNIYLNVPVAEFKLFEGAHVHHARIQRDSKKASHISRPVASLERNAEYHSYTICLGAKLFRNEPRVIQNAEEVDFTVDGLVLIDGEQIADTHSIMDHRFAHGNSHQLHKVVVNDKAHSIFNGKIFVAKDAQKIDSFQENRNLLLSEDGKVNTKPQLEIFADDVRCSHGATIGYLDEEEVFYLHSRGLTEQKARELLVYAFALESVESMEVESVEKLLLEEVIKYTTRD